jgi:endoglucanase
MTPSSSTVRSSFRALLFAVVVTGCGGAEHTTPPPATGTPSAAPPAVGQMTVGPSEAAGNDMLWNSTFAEGTLQPWTASVSSPARGYAKVFDEQACVGIVAGGTNPYDVILRQRPVPIAAGHSYQIRFVALATAPTKIRPRLAKAGPPYTEYWSSLIDVSTAPQTFTGTFEAGVSDEQADFAFHLGGDLVGHTPLSVCLDNIEINDPKFAARTRESLPRIRVNQVGYLPDEPKSAVVKDTPQAPLEWQLVDASNAVVASGKSRPAGEDVAAGELVQVIDFSAFKTPGKGYRIRIGKDESAPFEIGRGIYQKLKYDALAFFYQQRSGVEIAMPYAGSAQWARPAGHLSDKRVPCAPEARCDYSLDVSGGWYDAGDQGKYVVNAGIAVWTLQNEYERARYLGKNVEDFADGTMNIPERKNGVPDLLDEARFEVEWMLRMQVPPGKPMAGMVHHKIHDVTWAPIPMRPSEDDIKRYLRPVSTAATLNLAAAAAQASRLWKTFDPAFSKTSLEAAEVAWRAAKQYPDVASESDVKGGGSYGDSTFSDEFYWAAAELFITTGKAEYQKELAESPHQSTLTVNAGGGSSSMSWDQVAALGKISLAVVPNGLGKAAIDDQRRQIVGAANVYLGYSRRGAYHVSFASQTRYPWGSNSFVLNDMIIMGLAYDFTRDPKYVVGVVEGMDYLLGRNPKAQSYVSGYGARSLHNPHHRFWAHEKDATFPSVPPGIVSGGPNSGVEDPYARQLGLSGCAPQQCYVDDIESWSTNEIAINWNAPLAWVAAFLDDVSRRR